VTALWSVVILLTLLLLLVLSEVLVAVGVDDSIMMISQTMMKFVDDIPKGRAD
jgi:hypothetical protein